MNGASFIIESSIESKVIVKFFMNAINYKYSYMISASSIRQ